LSASIVKLRNRIQPYAWGSRHAIAELQGRPAPTAGPEAELWIGDHPAAPSCVIEPGRPGSPPNASAEVLVPLSEWIARDPEAVLGSGARCRVPHLPFLAKILAAERPLSLQVHPDAEQADAGFEREESAAVDADDRSYPDRIAKREVIIALSRFDALCGLRPDADVTRVLRDSGSEAARSLLANAIGTAPDPESPACLAARLFRRIQDLPAATRESLLDELSVAQQPQARSREHDEHYWVGRLRAEHPGDPLALAPLLLNLVSLAPGEGLAVEPGTLHCYLAGTGVEVMTRSDNIVRAGLTRKPVDRNAVREIAGERAAPTRRILPESSENGLDATYTTGIDDFDVAVLRTPEGRVVPRRGGRVSVLLCVGGSVVVQARPPGPAGVVRLDSGEAALIPACVESYELRGAGRDPRVFAVSSR
jgi:mannose-6-phosphate isomerase